MTYYEGSTPDSVLNVVRTGRRESPLVVLVHAVGMDLTYWERQIEALEPAHDVVAFDLRGHGSSSRCSGYGFDALAGDLAAVIAQADNGPAHIVGLSVGGMIAQTLAVAQPELVRSLSLVDTVSTFADPVRTALRARAQTVRFAGMGAILQPTLERWFTPEFAARRPEIIDRVGKTLLVADKDVHAAMWETIATLDVAPRLGALRMPTLVLVGEKDPTTPPAASQAIADSISQARLSVLHGVSHISPVEAPDAVNAHLIRFLTSFR
jgi:3-oxoadipate enol-lactonase